MKTKEEKLQLLKETAGFYNSGNTCVNDNNCFYWLKEKPHGCAVGRLFCTEQDRMEFAQSLTEGAGSAVYSIEIFRKLPPYIQDWGQRFLSNLQSLHDDDSNWNLDGLSPFGQRQVKQIENAILAGEI